MKKINPFFDRDVLKKAIVPWWVRILLFFVPTYVAIDDNYAVYYKRWGGVVYIVGEEKLIMHRGIDWAIKPTISSEQEKI